uniref:Uncharacterized protein n=1 Tax=Arundo donax TaxID=35708 RepID=A0A0A8ZSM2_ARUDO
MYWQSIFCPNNSLVFCFRPCCKQSLLFTHAYEHH